MMQVGTKVFKRYRFFFFGVGILMCSLFLLAPNAFAEVVRDVLVMAEANSGVAAREKALEEGRAEALGQLLAKRPNLVGKDDVAYILQNPQLAERFVDRIQIKSEQATGKKYRAVLDVYFSNAALKKLPTMLAEKRGVQPLQYPPAQQHSLQYPAQAKEQISAGMSSSGASNTLEGTAKTQAAKMQQLEGAKGSQDAVSNMVDDPYALVPIFISEDQTYLWQRDNPWYQLQVLQDPDFLKTSKIFLPLGDLFDMNTLTPEDLIMRRQNGITALAKRYGQKEVKLIILRRFAKTPFAGEAQIFWFKDGVPQQEAVLESEPQETQDVFMLKVLNFSKAQAQAETSGQMGSKASFGAQGGNFEAFKSPVGEREKAAGLSGGDIAAGSIGAEPLLERKTIDALTAAGSFVTAYYDSLAQWHEIQNRLRAIPQLNFSIKGISREKAQLLLSYGGSAQELSQALAGQGFVFEDKNGQMSLQILSRDMPALKQKESEIASGPLT